MTVVEHPMVARWAEAVKGAMHCECGKESHHVECVAALESLVACAGLGVDAERETLPVLTAAHVLAHATDNAERSAALGDLYNAVESDRSRRIKKALQVACDEEIGEGAALERICLILDPVFP